MKTVLFLCTGNYYRSRYAEILFNAKAEEMGLEWNAVSRGLAPDPRNPGPMSRDTMAALQKQSISVEGHLRLPMKVTDTDFESISFARICLPYPEPSCRFCPWRPRSM